MAPGPGPKCHIVLIIAGHCNDLIGHEICLFGNVISISHFIEAFQSCACDALVVVGCAGVRIHVCCGGGGGYTASLLSQRDVLPT